MTWVISHLRYWYKLYEARLCRSLLWQFDHYLNSWVFCALFLGECYVSICYTNQFSCNASLAPCGGVFTLHLQSVRQGPRWQSGNTLASHLCSRGSIPVMAVSGKAGSCLPLVGSLQYRTLANYMYWFPLPFQLPVVI